MEKGTKDEIFILLSAKLQNAEESMKRAILQGADGKREFEEYKRYVCALNDFGTFLMEDGELE